MQAYIRDGSGVHNSSPAGLVFSIVCCGPPISILALKDDSPGTIGAQAPGVKLQGLFKQPASMGGDQGLQQLP
ncbi:hypothetical protein SRHO_G00066770 [Serrasalmus rhombeus]